MADTFESIAVIPNPTDNYDEVWAVVSRDNGVYIERMLSRYIPRLSVGEQAIMLEDQVRMDCSTTFNDSISITNVSLGSATTLTASSHGLSNGDTIIVRCIDGTTQLNNNTYKVANKTTDTFEITDTGDVAIDSSAYTAYVAGGFVWKKNATLTGLAHLNDETCAVLADGNVLDQVTVSSGTVTLPSAYGLVHIGLPYNADLETLDVNVILKDGVSQGVKMKVGNVIFRFVDSKGGWIGFNDSNLHEAFTNLLISQNSSELVFSPSDFTFFEQSLTNLKPFLYSGNIREPLGGKHTKGGRVFFRQVDPTPVTITNIVPEVLMGEPV